MSKTAPYGSWPSPISAELVGAGEVKFSDLSVFEDAAYWVERRGALGVLVRYDGNQCADLTPKGISVGTRVHEYGGAPYVVGGESVVVSHRTDGSLWVINDDTGGEPQRLCNDGRRYADFTFDAGRQRLIAVCEEHVGGAVNNYLASVSLDSGEATPLFKGRDFFAAPRLSPDGKKLAWLTWDLPAMPWEWTELWIADVSDDGSLTNAQAVVATRNQSLLQPQWSPTGDLYVMSDKSNWWNLYHVDGDRLEAILPIEEDCSAPPWVLGLNSYAFIDESRVAVVSEKRGHVTVHVVDVKSDHARRHKLALNRSSATTCAFGGNVLMVGARSDGPTGVVSLDPKSGALSEIHTAPMPDLQTVSISKPQALDVSTRGGVSIAAYLYRPCNPNTAAPDGELPPLLVRAHGGPTGDVGTAFSLATQYWTSRGFAVLDVDYTGSTGYGREQRMGLSKRWGEVDVTDCIDAAAAAVAQGEADPKRLLVTGGSAGGFVVLTALARHPDAFAAGASYYGIADLALMQATTHKFEVGYNEFLLGSTDPDAPVYAERSPISYVAQISKPLIVFQGLEDAVVPPSQAEAMVAALRSREIPCAAYYFAHEGHGFRDPENVITALRAELQFYRHVLEIPSDDNLVLDLDGKA